MRRILPYIRVELDIAPLRKSKPARINFYRRGYKVGEMDAAPLVSYDIPAAVINRQNQYAAHQIDISMDTGAATSSRMERKLLVKR
ncbi:hypothetical protein [Segatella copri]|uniref:Uncharacterized protein n=1 Tax=Segatella copri TaxID=165179 RepID=A0AAW5U311_9BACT|nr:hypothetical protein [Segatella copri]MCW4094576.1 hypothetical protein [Segatella copri]